MTNEKRTGAYPTSTSIVLNDRVQEKAQSKQHFLRSILKFELSGTQSYFWTLQV
jgi:hypothetical protein